MVGSEDALQFVFESVLYLFKRVQVEHILTMTKPIQTFPIYTPPYSKYVHSQKIVSKVYLKKCNYPLPFQQSYKLK